MTKPIATQIMAAVCRECGIEPAELSGSTRRKAVIRGRSLYVGLCRTVGGMSYPEIQASLNKASHTASIDRFRSHERLMREDAEYLEAFKRCRAKTYVYAGLSVGGGE